MFVRFGLLRRTSGVSEQACRNLWAESRAPLVSAQAYG